MRKRIIASLLALVMTLVMVPAAASAEAAGTTTETIASRSLPKLATPAGLNWNKVYYINPDTSEVVLGDAFPGASTWKVDGVTQNKYTLKLYRTGETTPVGETQFDFGSNAYPFVNFRIMELLDDIDSGTYYFTAQSLGDGISYADSDIATSGKWSYVKPASKLETVTGLSWDWPYACFDKSSRTDVLSYRINFYYSSTPNSSKVSLGYVSVIADNIETGRAELAEHVISNMGSGYYYFEVRALNWDITMCQASDWSALSPAYYLGQDAAEVEEKLGEILDSLGSAQGAEDIQKAVQTIPQSDLRNAMLTDTGNAGTIAKLKQLEEATGITVETAVSEEMENVFDNNAVDIVGAALNDVIGDKVTLNISRPEEEHIIPTLYESSLAVHFGMELDGVANTSNLAVPVKITLPVPDNINPSFLVILHYHAATGEPEQIHPYVYQSEGKWYASFVLTSFSDFVMTELKQTSTSGSTGGWYPNYSGDNAPGNQVTVSAAANGSVTVTPLNAAQGTIVTIKTTPREGYEVGSVTVTDADGKTVSTQAQGDGSYTFTMPAAAVTVSVKFVETAKEQPGQPVDPVAPVAPAVTAFSDVKAGSWYADAVAFVAERGLMGDTGNGQFAPGRSIARNEVMTLLARFAGVDTSGGTTWDEKGMQWAVANELSDGTAPTRAITRQELATLLYRYAVKFGYAAENVDTASLSAYADASSVSAWAVDGMAWCVSNELITGGDAGLDPAGTASRAMVAAIMMRFCEKFAV